MTIYLAIIDKPADATIMGTLFVITHLFANVDKLKSFAAFGVRAELRDVIEKAEVTIDQARRLALTMARQTYYQYAVQGRMLGADWAAKNELIQALNLNLRELKVPAEQVEEARRGIFEFAQYDMIEAIHGSLNRKLLKNSVPQKDLPVITTYAGESVQAFSDCEELIKNHPRLGSDDKTELLAKTLQYRKALEASVKEGSFTHEALKILQE